MYKLALVSGHTLISIFFIHLNASFESRGRAVGIATSYGMDRSPGGVKNVHFSLSFRPARGPAQPAIQWVQGAVSPKVSQQGREANYSPATSAEVKKTLI
jgi:hypothetical protein